MPGWPQDGVHERLDALDAAGLIYWPKRGKMPSLKRYLASTRGTAVTDIFADISRLEANAKEKLGYPTQKPVALLKRIIQASSNEGDLVLDPFCGCGTTVVAAHAVKRRWAGIDISAFAVETVMKRRLRRVGIQVGTGGIPRDLEGARALARKDPLMFETWAISQIPGLAPNARQRGDGGVDGRGTLLSAVAGSPRRKVIVQVKSGKVSQNEFRAFRHSLREPANDAVAGVFITLERKQVTGPMRRTAAAAGTFRLERSVTSFPRLQFWSLEEWFREGRRPGLPPMLDPFTGKEMPRTIYEQ